ncbi:hypothetical protein [Labilibaculum euxinus]
MCFIECIKGIASDLEFTNNTIGAIREETIANCRGLALKEIESHFPYEPVLNLKPIQIIQHP